MRERPARMTRGPAEGDRHCGAPIPFDFARVTRHARVLGAGDGNSEEEAKPGCAHGEIITRISQFESGPSTAVGNTSVLGGVAKLRGRARSKISVISVIRGLF